MKRIFLGIVLTGMIITNASADCNGAPGGDDIQQCIVITNNTNTSLSLNGIITPNANLQCLDGADRWSNVSIAPNTSKEIYLGYNTGNQCYYNSLNLYTTVSIIAAQNKTQVATLALGFYSINGTNPGDWKTLCQGTNAGGATLSVSGCRYTIAGNIATSKK